ncbi:MAG: MFS transporter, partial [Hyphomicrobiales bacterium]
AQPVGGRLGDAFGQRRLVLLGLVCLLASSAGAALAWSFPLLLLTRSLQGVSAALFMPNAVAYLRKQVEPENLGRVLGTNGAAISTGAALGPVTGGLLLAFGDWRLLFLVNVPLALLAAWLVFRLEDDPGSGRSALAIDAVSLGALALSFTGLALAGTSARLHNPWLIAGGAAVLPVALAAYVLRYRARGRGVVDLRLFTRRNYAASAAGVALVNLVMYTTLIATPVYLSDLHDLGDGRIGLMLFAMSVAMVGISPIAGRWVDRLGARPLVVTGAGALVVAALVLAAMVGGPPVAWLLLPLGVLGIGVGLTQAAQQTAALRAWPAAVAGSASGTFSMMRYVGSVTGTGIMAAVLGAHPGEGAFRVLFAVLAGFAVAAVLAALSTSPKARQA